MERILAIDTTARSTHCALLEYGALLENGAVSESGKLLAQASASAFGTAESLADLMLRIADDLPGALQSVTRVVVAVGPGSFTGIRGGIASAQGFAAGLDVPVTGLSVLLARLSMRPVSGKVLVPYIEASPTEFFSAAFTLSLGENTAKTTVTLVQQAEVIEKAALEQHIVQLEKQLNVPVTAIDVGCDGDVLQGGEANNPAIALGRAVTLFMPLQAEDLGLHWQETDRGIGITALYVKSAQAKTIAERRAASGGKG